jgi:hypothetical protein
MIVAIATFSESACPAIGIRTGKSASFSQNSLSPYCSLPITTASGPRRSASEYSFVAAGVVATARIPRARSQARTGALSATTSGTEKSTPVEARTTFGLKGSVTGSQTITASQPAASALRRIVPRLPGFSMPSTTSRNGSRPGAGAGRSSKPRCHCGATARSPSGRSR